MLWNYSSSALLVMTMLSCYLLGETVEKRLDNARNNFEKSKTDVFPLEAPNLGPLKRVVIRHDNSGPSPAWYCLSVSIISRQLQFLQFSLHVAL